VEAIEERPHGGQGHLAHLITQQQAEDRAAGSDLHPAADVEGSG